MSFVRRNNKIITDINNQPFTLKGVGIGGWLLFEGYMYKSNKYVDRQRRFNALLDELVGIENRISFNDRLANIFFSEKDIKLIKEEGFNSIRIPFDYQYLYKASNDLEELEAIDYHFELLDNIINLCKKHEVYVILDMHAAPGGQTGANIDNSDKDIPELFINDLYKLQTIYIWKELAKRYKDEEWIACYDLLNEPIPKHHNQYNDLLLPLYKELIKAIREVDQSHMISIEGLNWSTDLSCFKDLMDDNQILHFHKYWNPPTTESIIQHIRIREELNTPIFMGESGENEIEWYSAAFKMLDQQNISYNFWTYKKMDNTNSVISFAKPANWDRFINKELSKTESLEVLEELLNNIAFDNSKTNYDVINHIQTKNTFKTNAFAFDFYGKGKSYYNQTLKQTSMRAPSNIRIANCDNLVIEPDFWRRAGKNTPKEDILYVHLEKDEWLNYSFSGSIGKIGKITVNSNQIKNLSVFLNDRLLESNSNEFVSTLEKELNVIRLVAKDLVRIKDIDVSF